MEAVQRRLAREMGYQFMLARLHQFQEPEC
jgi:hypothetical protein